MGGSSGAESSSPTLVGIRAFIRCCTVFLSAARISSLCEKNQNTSITATAAPRNMTMVINQIICARTQTDDSAEPTARAELYIRHRSLQNQLLSNPSVSTFDLFVWRSDLSWTNRLEGCLSTV